MLAPTNVSPESLSLLSSLGTQCLCLIGMTLAFGPLTFGLAGIIPHSRESLTEMQKQLKRAGYYRPFALQEFLSIRNGIVVLWILLVATTLWAAYDPQNDPTLLILAVGGLALMALYAMPRMIVDFKAKRRINNIQVGLPDALDMVSMCLTGGMPLLQSLDRVSHELRYAHPDIATEFDIICRHSEAHTLDYAINQFSQRIDIPEIRSLAAIVAQTERLGTNVSAALRDYADGVRRAYRQRAEERGNKTSVKMLLPISMCLAPPVYILLLAPALLELRDFVVRENKPGGVLSPGSTPVGRMDQAARLKLSATLREAQQKRRAIMAANRAANPPRANRIQNPTYRPNAAGGDAAPAAPATNASVIGAGPGTGS